MDEATFGSGNGHNGNGFRRRRPSAGALGAGTMRDLVGVLFHRRRLVLRSFAAMVLTVILVAVFVVSNHYVAHMKIIVNHTRQDPVVNTSTSPETPSASTGSTTTEEELNSEVELLKSYDLLSNVAQATGLDKKHSMWDLFTVGSTSPQVRTERAARKLASDLKIEALKKSNIITVSYASKSPQLAANVLTVLAQDYMQKHLDVRRTPGALDFFEAQTLRFRKDLVEQEAKLATYSEQQKVGAASLIRDAAAQKIADFDSTLRTTQAQIGQTEQRIKDLEQQIAATPTRMETAVQSSTSSLLLDSLRGTLLSLELKRTELLTKYDPSYRLVKEVDKQIADARKAIEQAEIQPTLSKTTDRDPTYEMLREDLGKAKADLAGYQGLANAMAVGLNAFREDSVRLEQMSLSQGDLTREVKADEDNYLLYMKKEEEARIANALDTERIVNVALAEPPMVPALPSTSPVLFTLLGLILDGVISLVLAFLAEYLDSSFRTPDQIEDVLDIPVFASIPRGGN
jgi:uncharacterized protein involved in exopolysaccharide biosynthesis